MEKTIIDERTSWEYELIDDLYYPTGRVQRGDVMTPSEPPVDNGPEEAMTIRIWGQRHLHFIRQYKKSLYFDLFVWTFDFCCLLSGGCLPGLHVNRPLIDVIRGLVFSFVLFPRCFSFAD